jgi:hypothetical protein
MSNFQIKALPAGEFVDFFNMDDIDLEKIGAKRMKVDKKPGYPCRISLQDAESGEEVILLPYQHHKTNSPYQSSGPIYIRKNAVTAKPGINEIPKMLNHRLLSLRAYNSQGMMKHATVSEGVGLLEALHAIFAAEEISYVHIHNAKAGCYNCMVERA